MGKIYQAMQGMYPELDEMTAAPELEADNKASKPSAPDTPEVVHKAETQPKSDEQRTVQHQSYAPYNYASASDSPKNETLPKQLPRVNESLKPIEDNKWVRALNKIVSKIVSTKRNSGGLLFFVGAEQGVGSTTVSYWASRLLATFSNEHRTLFISISNKKAKKNQIDIFSELRSGNATEEELLASLPYETFNHIVLHIDKKTLQSPSTPNTISRLVRSAKNQFHWVVMDSPPLLTVPPAYSLAAESDGVVLVAKAGKTRIPTLNALTEELEERKANVLGVVLNFRQFPLPSFLMKFF